MDIKRPESCSQVPNKLNFFSEQLRPLFITVSYLTHRWRCLQPHTISQLKGTKFIINKDKITKT